MRKSVLGQCACGSIGGENAAHCERCRMIYAIKLMADVRTAQKAYFKTRTKTNITAAFRAEAKIDKVLERLLVGDTDEALASSPLDA